MPRPRFNKAPLEKREAVLDAAAKEFAEHGYEDASVNRTLLAAGFSKGSFYYYFDDKLDLAAAVLEREAERYMTLWTDLRTPRTPKEFWSEIERMMNRATEQLRSAPHATDALFRLGTAVTRHPELLERISTSIIKEATAKLTDFWKHGQTIGAVRKDLPLGTLVSLLQEAKLALVRLLLPYDRAPSNEELELFGRVHLDLVRRVSEERGARA